jgi:hypothetical protein
MADLELAFASDPVAAGKQTAFVEGSLGIGETTVELDLTGNVRPVAVVFEAGFTGASITVSVTVPWVGGDAAVLIDSLAVTPVAGKVVPLPAANFHWPEKLLFTVNTGQAAAKNIGFFGWRADNSI